MLTPLDKQTVGCEELDASTAPRGTVAAQPRNLSIHVYVLNKDDTVAVLPVLISA